MDINIWNSKSDQVQSWRTQEWCNYFSFSFFSFSLFCINSVTFWFSLTSNEKNFIAIPPHVREPQAWFCGPARNPKTANEEGAFTRISPPLCLFEKLSYAAKKYSTARCGYQQHFEDLLHKTK